MTSGPLVKVEGISVDFDVAARTWGYSKQRLRAVDRASFEIHRGATFGLVGESGSGKTTIGLAMLGLHKLKQGRVLYDGRDIGSLTGKDLAAFRRKVQFIFQDPYTSLNGRMKVGDIIAEPLRAHRLGGRAERKGRVQELLELVGLPARSAVKFPHSFSGGQRQRIAIARALALRPEFIVADEPVSALDVSIRAQILNLIKELQENLGLTVLFIGHDLAVVRQVADRVAVMYLGKIVEEGPRAQLFTNPQHPYTKSLLSAVPVPDPPYERARRRIILSGEIPSPIKPPSGCRFHTRCPYAFDPCFDVEPQLLPTGDGGVVACHLVHPPATSVSVGQEPPAGIESPQPGAQPFKA